MQVRSRLGGSMITAPGPPQHTTEDIAMSSVFNFSATRVERIVLNVSLTPLSASPRIEVRSPAQGQALNPPKIASPHHVSGDIAMHIVATLDNAKEGTSSSIDAALLHAVLPPAVRPADKESPSAITSAGVCYSFDDDIYGDEPMDSGDDQTAMGATSNDETLMQDSTISRKSSGPEGVDASPESTANLMYTTDTNASALTLIVEVKEEVVTSSEAEVNRTTNPDGPVAAPSPAADRISVSFSQSLEQNAASVATVTNAENAEFALAQFGEESMDFGISESNGRVREEIISLSEEPLLHSMDVEQQPEVSDSSKLPLITLSSSQPSLPEIPPAIEIDDVDMSANPRRANSAPSADSLTLESNTLPVVSLGDENHIEMMSASSTNPLALQTFEAPIGSSIASSHAHIVEGAPVVQASPASNARQPKTALKALTPPKSLKPSAEPAVLPSSEKEKAKKVAVPAPSPKTPRKLTKNPGISTKAASTLSNDLKVPPDVTNSPKTKSPKDSKAKSIDNNTTANPPAVPGKRPENASNAATKQISSEKTDDQPPSSIATMSQKPKAESSFDTEKSTKVQASPPTAEHMEPSKSKGRNKEKETSECHPDNAPTKAADGPSSSTTTDRASIKEPTVAGKTSSPSSYFVPTGYSFAKKDSAAPVPGCALPSLS